MSSNFQRTVEDFTCAHCGAQVQGDGYTNHCPQCLWSQHVDRAPGDRAADCGGLMQPMALDGVTSERRILHRCQVCGHEKWNRTAPEDSFEALVALAEQQARDA